MNYTFEISGNKIHIKTKSLQNIMDFNLDKPYIQFIEKHGYGIISEKVDFINIISPDKDFLKATFSMTSNYGNGKTKNKKN